MKQNITQYHVLDSSMCPMKFSTDTMILETGLKMKSAKLLYKKGKNVDV